MTKAKRQINQFYTKLGLMNQKVDIYYGDGKFHKCIKILGKALEETKQKQLKVHEGLTSLKLADLYVAVYDYEQAIDYYKKGLKCLDYTGGPMTKTVARIYRGLYECYLALDSHDEIIKYGMMACEYSGLSARERADINANVATSLLKVYQEEAVMVHLIRGLNFAKEAIKHYRLAGDQDTLAYIHGLYICGNLYYLLGEREQAMATLEEAYERSGGVEIGREVFSKLCYLLYRLSNESGNETKALHYKSECLQF